MAPGSSMLADSWGTTQLKEGLSVSSVGEGPALLALIEYCGPGEMTKDCCKDFSFTDPARVSPIGAVLLGAAQSTDTGSLCDATGRDVISRVNSQEMNPLSKQSRARRLFWRGNARALFQVSMGTFDIQSMTTAITATSILCNEDTQRACLTQANLRLNLDGNCCTASHRTISPPLSSCQRTHVKLSKQPRGADPG
ncbi:uncharacterized protein isoform X2 [Salmo salar]|uniref:Uncharacterized protein isoform X2 n=1 Tax=Salmo salar TaxID=8030 RepID=A0A1S3SG86_SALSA|nr:uncharacterized protein LOC106609266 isoform X2 [Salmo salar]|eukprot:XP_014063346.1 PREDICTED: uncharacterized protein LOC106609266 isoform X2 [Salmo salar]